MSDVATAKVTIDNRLGLHARPAMLFAETASKFDSDICIRRSDGEEKVDGKSIMQLMMLAATKGTEIEISASGDDSSDAIKELVQLVENHFMED